MWRRSIMNFGLKFLFTVMEHVGEHQAASASVLMISMVCPDMVGDDIAGRCALPSGMFPPRFALRRRR